MEDSLLYKAAIAWRDLCEHSYRFKYGLKKKVYTIHILFSPDNFFHLAGLHYLTDITFPMPRVKYKQLCLKKIIDEKDKGKAITQELIETSLSYASQDIESRLQAIISIKNILDGNTSLRSFIKHRCQSYTQINADFLLSNNEGEVIFLFIINNRDKLETKKDLIYECACVTAFKMDHNKDYRKGQTELTILEKTRIKLQDKMEEVLFRKTGFQE